DRHLPYFPTRRSSDLAEKYGLNFTLLSDESHEVMKAYNSWGTMMANRNTFIINPKGEIVKEYKGVEPNDHAAEIINDLKELQARSEEHTSELQSRENL